MQSLTQLTTPTSRVILHWLTLNIAIFLIIPSGRFKTLLIFILTTYTWTKCTLRHENYPWIGIVYPFPIWSCNQIANLYNIMQYFQAVLFGWGWKIENIFFFLDSFAFCKFSPREIDTEPTFSKESLSELFRISLYDSPAND